MKKLNLFVFVFYILAQACSKPTAIYQFELGGACVTCPISDAEEIIKGIKGVSSVSIDKEFNATVEFDSTITTRGKIMEMLNHAGYEVDMETIAGRTQMKPCCTPDLDDDLSMDDDLDFDELDLDDLDLDFGDNDIDYDAEMDKIDTESLIQLDDEDLMDFEKEKDKDDK